MVRPERSGLSSFHQRHLFGVLHLKNLDVDAFANAVLNHEERGEGDDFGQGVCLGHGDVDPYLVGVLFDAIRPFARDFAGVFDGIE